MPERELPEALRARLSAELTSGAPLHAPLASQARYAGAASLAVPRRSLRGGLLVASAAALAVLVVAALAGPPQPRGWIVQSVGMLAGDRGAPSPTPSIESQGTISPRPSPSHAQSPEAAPEPRESPEPAESPGAHESPEPIQSPSGDQTSTGDGEGSSPSPSTSPSEGGSGG
jgi:hypothetical protein